MPETTDAVAEAVARRSYGKLVAILAARTRDVTAAEDALADAFASALAHWPASGIPDNPEAWLLATARRKAIDGVRKEKTRINADPHLKLIAEEASEVIEELPSPWTFLTASVISLVLFFGVCGGSMSVVNRSSASGLLSSGRSSLPARKATS